jgi:hypothetical protein
MCFWRHGVVGGAATPLAHRPRLNASQIPVGLHPHALHRLGKLLLVQTGDVYKRSDFLQQMRWMATDKIATRPPKGKHQ